MREDNYIPLYMRAPLIAQRRGPRNGAFVNDPEAFLSEPRLSRRLVRRISAAAATARCRCYIPNIRATQHG